MIVYMKLVEKNLKDCGIDKIKGGYMKIKTKNLIKGLRNINKIKKQYGILNNCKITIDKDIMYIEKISNDCYIQWKLNIQENDKKYIFFISEENIEILLKKLNNKVLYSEIKIEENNIIVNNIKYNIINGNLEDYPDIPECENIDFIKIKTDDLKQVYVFAGNDTVKPVFNSVYIENNKMIATDSRKLCVKDIAQDKEFSKMIPLSIVNMIKDYKNKTVTIFYDDTLMKLYISFNKKTMFDSDICECNIYFKEIYGVYPNYKQVISDIIKDTIEGKFDVQWLQKNVEKCIDENKENVTKKIIFENKRVYSYLYETENEIYSFNIDYNFNFKMNGLFLLDVLNSIDSNYVYMYYNNKNGPVLFKNNNGDFMGVVMPIKR